MIFIDEKFTPTQNKEILGQRTPIYPSPSQQLLRFCHIYLSSSLSPFFFKYFKSNSKHVIRKYGLKKFIFDFPWGPEVRNTYANAEDMSWIPGLGRSHLPRSSQAQGHNYWSLGVRVSEFRNYWARLLQLLKPECSKGGALQEKKPLLPATRASLCAARKTQESQK